MAHMRVEIDGQERFNGEVPNAYLPENPSMFPKALGAPGHTGAAPTPLAKLFMLTAVVELCRKMLEAPMIGPIDVTVTPRGPGCGTITFDGPQLNIDDLKP
jgi:hypothetical protein